MAGAITYYLTSFAFVSFSIALFFAPFLFSFWYRSRKAMAGKQVHFNYFMEKFFLSMESNIMVLLWAAGEAIVWFVIPEFLLVLMIFMKIKRKRELVKYDVAGTVAGTLIALGLHLPSDVLLKMPYVYQGMITQVGHWFDANGILGILYQPFSGVPFKIFNALALDYGFFIPLYIILAISARVLRYIVAYQVMNAIYPFVHKFVRRHYAILFAVAIAVFTMLLMQISKVYN